MKPSDKKAATPTSDCRHFTIQKLSGGVLSVQEDDEQGAYVVAKEPLHPGQVLLECPSASIALDPPYRQTHCGYCARPLTAAPTAEQNSTCEECHLLSVCKDCHEKWATDWHKSGGECLVLKSLVRSFMEVFSEFEGQPAQSVALQIESIYIITARLLHRRHFDHEVSKETTVTKELTCPLPAIDWKLFDSLYSCPLPTASDDSSSFVTAMASLFQELNNRLMLQSTSNENGIKMKAFNPQECISIWSKCRGCCHAVTDFSRPLGAQNLGMALLVPQSFYNHACTPNAFLSCLLGEEKEVSAPSAAVAAPALAKTTGPQPHCCAVISRVVCCIAEGISPEESVNLSYIPLSGLCVRERQIRLREGYHFQCHCTICRERTLPNTDGYTLEQAVGGEFAAGVTQDEDLHTLVPLRELQISCYQQLMTASAMDRKSPVITSKDCDSIDNSQVDVGGDDVNDEEGGEEDPRADLIEQSIATLEMAQRGIRNQKIPPSHEVSLECHRLLALAYGLLRRDSPCIHEKDDDAVAVQEQYHHEQFFEKAQQIESFLDPSALMIQHKLVAECLQSGEGNNEKDSRDYHYHINAALELGKTALGEDHPFLMRLRPLIKKRELNLDCEFSYPSAKKRKPVQQLP